MIKIAEIWLKLLGLVPIDYLGLLADLKLRLTRAKNDRNDQIFSFFCSSIFSLLSLHPMISFSRNNDASILVEEEAEEGEEAVVVGSIDVPHEALR